MTSDYSNLKEIVKRGVKNGEFPRYIYKYRTLSPFLFDIFSKQELWFSQPSDFNDPFDCQIVPDTANTIDEIKTFIKRSIDKPIHDIELTALAFEGLPNWSNFVNESIKKILNETGVCCFTKKQDNILLWSHYTDSHKGVCLKFDLLEDPLFFIFPMNMIYRKDYPKYNHLRDNKKLADLLIKSKSDVWSYEEEIRIVKPNGFGSHKFKKSALVEITFGCRCLEDDIRKIKDTAFEYNFSHLDFKKAQMKKQEYGLDFKSI